MRTRVNFECPFPGTHGTAYVSGDEVTFELLDCSTEISGSGRTEFWGHPVTETFAKHLVNEATVVAINGQTYDRNLHGGEEKFLSLCSFRVSDVPMDLGISDGY